MREAIIVLILLAGGILLASCAWLGGEDGATPPRGPAFDHKAHEERGAGCSDCHGDAAVGWKAMPPLATCMECHEEIDVEDVPADRRAAAFYDTEGKLRRARTAFSEEVIFDHAGHVKDESSCRDCHARVADSTRVPADAAVTMDDCVACHQKSAPQANECASCHVRTRRDRMPPDHAMGWLQKHGREARVGRFDTMPRDCTMCHERSSCDECHRSEKPRNHNSLWRHRGHAAMASIQRENCTVCHTTDSCALCHQQMTPRNHRGTWGSPFDRHCYGCHLPLGGSSRDGCVVCHKGQPQGHAMAPPRPADPSHATSDPGQCRTCHVPMPHPDNGQTCLFCHM
jgi:hypothetical protein